MGKRFKRSKIKTPKRIHQKHMKILGCHNASEVIEPFMTPSLSGKTRKFSVMCFFSISFNFP